MKRRILLAEDERELALMMASVLESRDYSVVPCFSGNEALSEYEPEKTDLLVTDLKMPGISGLELILKVREKNTNQRILVTTGIKSPGRVHAFKPRTMSFISKPFSASKLLFSVNKALIGTQMEQPISQIHFRKDLISLCSFCGGCFVFEIRSKADKGYIYIQEGIVVHAHTQSKEGREAFDEILSWENGSFYADPLKQRITQPTILASLETLIKKK